MTDQNDSQKPLSAVEQRVVGYIKTYKGQGHSDREIKDSLKKSGIPGETIRKGFEIVTGKKPVYKTWWFWTLIGLVLILALIISLLPSNLEQVKEKQGKTLKEGTVVPECTSSTNCGSNEVCVDNKCIQTVTGAKRECDYDVDCGEGFKCDKGSCVKKEFACGDNACGDGEECALDCGCSTDDECEAYGDYECNDGKCETVRTGGGGSTDTGTTSGETTTTTTSACTSDSNCSSGQTCVSGACTTTTTTTSSCTSDSNCSSGQTCVSGACTTTTTTTSGCTSDSECGTGETCVSGACTTTELENYLISSIDLLSRTNGTALFNVVVEHEGREPDTTKEIILDCSLYNESGDLVSVVELYNIEDRFINNSADDFECSLDPSAILEELTGLKGTNVTMIATVDSTDVVDESNETDNTLSYAAKWKAAPTPISIPECSTDDDCEPNEKCDSGNCVTVSREISGQRCSDHWDNDGDGLVDFPFDRGCTSVLDDDERNRCGDKWDNDNDGLIDMDDPECSSPADQTEDVVETRCDDGWDNDGDGLVDYPEDDDCTSAEDDDERDDNVAETTETSTTSISSKSFTKTSSTANVPKSAMTNEFVQQQFADRGVVNNDYFSSQSLKEKFGTRLLDETVIEMINEGSTVTDVATVLAGQGLSNKVIFKVIMENAGNTVEIKVEVAKALQVSGRKDITKALTDTGTSSQDATDIATSAETKVTDLVNIVEQAKAGGESAKEATVKLSTKTDAQTATKLVTKTFGTSAGTVNGIAEGLKDSGEDATHIANVLSTSGASKSTVETALQGTGFSGSEVQTAMLNVETQMQSVKLFAPTSEQSFWEKVLAFLFGI